MVFGFFKKKKKIKEITLDEVNSWMQKAFESKNISLKLSIYKRELNSKKIKIKELLKELEDTGIKDESVVPERAKNIFYGNKSSYIQKVNAFIETIDYPEELFLIENFLEESSLKLEELAKETNKNYFIIKEFAEDEIRSVANKIKEFDNVISASRNYLEKTSYKKFNDLKNLLKEYYESEKRVEEIKKDMEEVLRKKGEEIQKKKKVELKIDELKKSKNYEDYSEIKKKKEVLEEEIKQSEYKIIDLFSGISSTLKKYGKKKKNITATNYADNAIEALIKDDNLKILKVLEDLIKIKETLDIKDSKIKKIDSDVKKITNTKIENAKQKIINKKQDIKDIKNRLKNHSFILNLKEQEGKLSLINQNIEDIEKEEQEVEETLERVNPRLIKQKIKKVIKEIDETTELK